MSEDLADTSTRVRVTVRYFAAARAAAGVEDEMVTVAPGSTVGELVEELGARGYELEKILRRCSLLCDGMAVKDPSVALRTNQTIDVLPPFAGG